MLGGVLQAQGHKLQPIRLYDGEPVPADLDNVDGVVSMGGPMNVDEIVEHPWIEDEMAYLRAAHDANVPIVGVCLGAQLIAGALGGTVAAMEQPEVGWQNLKLAFPGTIDPVYTGIGWETTQFHLHGQEVTKLPPGAAPLAGSAMCRNQAFKVGLTTYAFQYHFEWDRAGLDTFAHDAIVMRAGDTPAQIQSQTREFYDDYRRLGDRLCHTLATILLPIDKR